MSGLAAQALNCVKAYNLSAGKTLPQWLAQKTKKALSRDEDYRRPLELVQDFTFPVASHRVIMKCQFQESQQTPNNLGDLGSRH